MNRESGNTRSAFTSKLGKKVYFMHNNNVITATLLMANPKNGVCIPDDGQPIKINQWNVHYSLLHTTKEGNVDSHSKVNIDGITISGDKDDVNKFCAKWKILDVLINH